MSDENVKNDYEYLFPDPDLREKAEKCRKNYGYQLLSSAIVTSFMAICIICVFCTGWVLETNLIGYAYPIFFGTTTLLTTLACLQSAYYVGKVEKEQRKRIEGKPEYAKTAELYELYDEYGKFRGKTIVFSMLVSIVVSLAVALVFPDKLWSFSAFAVVALGAVLQKNFYAAFREKVSAKQKEIDEENAKDGGLL